MTLNYFKPAPGIIGASTTKSHGNLSYTVGEEAQQVLQSRIALADEVGIDLSHWVFARQCHSSNFKKVSLADKTRGVYSHEDGIEDVDALYTFDKELVLAFFHADCVPILFADPTRHLIGAIHAGWQGTLSEIVKKTLHHCISEENINPQNLKVFVGPCLDKHSAQIKGDIQPYLVNSTFDKTPFIIDNKTSYSIDTRGLTLKMLDDLGVLKENILNLDEDTCLLDDKYYSAQRDGLVSGRHLTFIFQDDKS